LNIHLDDPSKIGKAAKEQPFIQQLALEKAFKAPSTVVEWEGPAKVLTSKE
jgi:hypothetical protein